MTRKLQGKWTAVWVAIFEKVLLIDKIEDCGLCVF